MTSLAIILVLSSAFTHALWNFLAKRAKTSGVIFVWMFGVIEVTLYFPVMLFVVVTQDVVIGVTEIFMMVGSSFIHLSYFVALTRGYKLGDLSVVYPLSRGIGPLLSTILAIVVLAERPTLIAFMGTVLLTIGIIWLTGDPRKLRGSDILPSLFYALLTGLSIAAYTIWDSHAVNAVGMSPIVYEWGTTLMRATILTPIAIRNWDRIKAGWAHDKLEVTGVAVLSSLSYILMLFALSFSLVSYVAPLRSISILMGVFMGARLLNEGDLRKRLGAAGVMVLGAIALGLG